MPQRADLSLVAVLVVLLVCGALLSCQRGEGHRTVGPWVGLGLQVLVAGALLVRRNRPVAVLGAVTAAAALMSLSVWLAPGLLMTSVDGAGVWVPLAAPLAVYSALVYAGRKRTTWVLTGALVAIAARPWYLSFGTMASGLVLIGVPALLGLYVAARRGLIAALTERAERAEREQHLLAEQARAEERVRLAGEMHDVVTHRVSLMVLQAGALRMVAQDERVRGAAEELRAAGCQALDELRDVVGVLRSPASAVGTVCGEGKEAGAEPGWRLAGLVEESRAVGVEVRLTEAGDRSVLSAVTARTAYRLVQEALTNVRKHAPGSSVVVEARYEVDRLRVWVRNTAPSGPLDTDLATSGSGSGLKGLRQRVELVGGTIEYGPRADGGFQVNSVLPAEPTAGYRGRHGA
ncbi:two-component sensor histidine kinase [Streptomyces sp. G44]|uniref:sensor histidine kinase n=1 Tax=Streptomyces sp. G44 TaxID=2807632 RepID=UPI0019611984|nr:histidine kinase [Streptomyces sp. G44]MBM7172308.1 two-component sensor histidine kinase [Streptomyces sp. G44]